MKHHGVSCSAFRYPVLGDDGRSDTSDRDARHSVYTRHDKASRHLHYLTGNTFPVADAHHLVPSDALLLYLAPSISLHTAPYLRSVHHNVFRPEYLSYVSRVDVGDLLS